MEYRICQYCGWGGWIEATLCPACKSWDLVRPQEPDWGLLWHFREVVEWEEDDGVKGGR